MCCNCRRPINCYNDKTRYKTLIVPHTIELIFFIIRLSLVSNDISKGVSATKGFLVPILLFDLFGSVPIIICNIIYVIMRHCLQPLVYNNSSFEYLWHLATLTCIRLKCHKDRPQAILLMRIILIVGSFILKFICFTIAASCSAKFNSECTGYTVIAAFSLLSFTLVIIVEFVNFFRLWKYNPTDTRNHGNNNQIGSADTDVFITRTHRCHLGFVHYSLLNDENSQSFRHSRCKNGINCKSESLHHYLFYHSLEFEHNINFKTLTDNEKKSFIAFHQTTKKEAFNIAEKGFPYGDNTNSNQKDYLHLKQIIFFTRSCTQNLEPAEAIICVRLNLGRIIPIIDDDNLNLNDYFGWGDGSCDTVYIEKSRRIYLRMPGQIEKWIITITKNVTVNDVLDGTSYQPCL
jgi:hypothetical protein